MDLPRTLELTRRVASFTWNHPANEGHRVRALGRAAQYQVLSRVSDKPLRTRIGDSLTLLVPPRSPSASMAVYANPPNWPEMNAWRLVLRPGDLFVDIGSNVGVYSLWAADCGAIPWAFEPDPVNAQRARDNLAENHVTGRVFETALGAATGTMRFSSGQDTMNHLVMGDDPDARAVPVDTFDRVVGARAVRGMKVDVEGAERLVLEGASQALASQRIDVIQLEWNELSQSLLAESREPLRQLLEGTGYRLARPDPKTFRLRPVEDVDASVADMFAVSPAFRAQSGGFDS